MKKKIAVIGFGFMGVVHAQNILTSDNLELSAIIDKRDNLFDDIDDIGNKGSLGVPIEQLKKIPVYKSLEDCLEYEQLDAVSICVPLFLHYKLANQALSLGLDVLLEKPFCQTVEECQKLIDLANEKNRILMVAHCIRFHPAYQFLAACINDERFGKLKILSMTRQGGRPTWGVWNNPDIQKTCGGGLWDLLIHDLDFVNHHIGVSSTPTVNVKVDDYWQTSFKKNGAIISIQGGFLHANASFEGEFFATFDKGSIEYSTNDPDNVYVSTDNGLEKIPNMTGNSYATELEYFAQRIKDRQTTQECLPKEAMKAIEICTNLDQACIKQCIDKS